MSKSPNKMPKKLTIFGKTVKVKVVELPEDTCGDFEKNVIRIRKSLSHDEQMGTLIHEIFHAILYNINISQIMPHELEEIIIENFTETLTQLFELKLK
jgi:hypothetical protein